MAWIYPYLEDISGNILPYRLDGKIHRTTEMNTNGCLFRMNYASNIYVTGKQSMQLCRQIVVWQFENFVFL